MMDGRLVAVGGGKGGVGKSLVAANLAVALAQSGADVVLIDVDLGAPNQHTLFGMHRPAKTVDNFLDGRVASLTDVVLDTGIPRLRIICGNPPVLGSANPTWALKQKLIRQLPRLGADCLLIDVGAGVDFNVVDFFNAADVRIMVVTPEMTSLQNAYGFMKIAIYRRLQRAVAGHPLSKTLSDAFGDGAFQIASGMEKMSTFLSLVEDEAPGLLEPFQLLLAEFNPKIVGNMLAKQADLNVIWAVQRMMKGFLGLDADVSAAIRANPFIRASINAGRPFMVQGGDADSAAFARLARGVLEQDLQPIREMRERIAALLSRSGPPVSLGVEDVANPAADEVPSAMQSPTPSARRQSAPPEAATIEIAPDCVASPAAVAHASWVAVHEHPGAEATRVSSEEDRDGQSNEHPSAEATRTSSEGPDEQPKQGRRDTGSIQLNHPLEVEIDKHWYVGTLVEMGESFAVVAGIANLVRGRPEGALRLMMTARDSAPSGDGVPIPVLFAASDGTTGGVLVHFKDPTTASPLISYFRRLATQTAV